MSNTAFITHTDCILHSAGSAHPECPGRLDSIAEALAASNIQSTLKKVDAQPIIKELLSIAHDKKYIERIFEQGVLEEGYVHVDADTAMNKHSLRAAMLAAGAGVQAIDGIMDNVFQRAFCDVRPPGHHAEKDRGMGFCIFNNIAIAALYAIENYHFERVAIVDFDVHHGNGTENIVAGNQKILFCSSYQHPFYPYASPDQATANCIHCPLPANTGSASLRSAYERIILPSLKAFEPELILFSAGFDAHEADPLAQWKLKDDDFYWITEQVLKVANICSKGRVVSFLEGGYNLDQLGSSVCAHLRALLDN